MLRLHSRLALIVLFLLLTISFHSQFLNAQDGFPTLVPLATSETTNEVVLPETPTPTATITPTSTSIPLWLLAPLDGSENISDKPFFSWMELPNATRYILIVVRQDQTRFQLKFAPSEICFSGICSVDTSLLSDFEPLEPNQFYGWFVKARTPEGQVKSLTYNFSTTFGMALLSSCVDPFPSPEPTCPPGQICRDPTGIASFAVQPMVITTCTPTQIPTNTATYTATSTPTATFTPTYTPSSTPTHTYTPSPTLAEGECAIRNLGDRWLDGAASGDRRVVAPGSSPTYYIGAEVTSIRVDIIKQPSTDPVAGVYVYRDNTQFQTFSAAQVPLQYTIYVDKTYINELEFRTAYNGNGYLIKILHVGICGAVAIGTPTPTPLPTSTPTITPSATPTETPTELPICEESGSQMMGAMSAPVCQELPTATPTFTQTPDADCSDGTIDIISQEQYQTYSSDSTRELKDMRILSLSGVSPLTNPTINAKPFDSLRSSLQWSRHLEVHRRIEFPQTLYRIENQGGTPTNVPVADRQVWYEVSDAGSQYIYGWIPARYDGNNYVQGNDPCNGKSSISEPSSLTFTYDRRSASEYAIVHSYDYNQFPSELEIGHVTRKLSGIPFADFDYSYLSSEPGSTGSTMFVSQAIWAGGIPMTVGDPNSCLIAPNSAVSEGWRYCRSTFGASNPWDFHQQLLNYFSHATVPKYYYENSVLQGNSIGRKLDFTGCGTFKADRISSGDVSLQNPSVIEGKDLGSFFDEYDDRKLVIVNPIGLAAFLQSILTVNCNGNVLIQGDYIYINPQDPDNLGDSEAVEDGHGLLIVGWGPVTENCSSVFTSLTIKTVNEFSIGRTDENPVPWVVDFTTAQPTIPRPFYCTMAFDDGQFGSYFYRHDWFFFHLPETITLQPSEIYINPDWNW